MQLRDAVDIKQLIEEGLAYRTGREYRKAAKRFESAARMGSVEAMFLAGENILDAMNERIVSVCYTRDQMQEDAEYRQFDYFFRSAEGGHPPAMLRVAQIYHRGCALFAPNPGKAVYWYASALRHGEEDAREPLAACYESGFGVEKNPETAKKIRAGTSHF